MRVSTLTTALALGVSAYAAPTSTTQSNATSCANLLAAGASPTSGVIFASWMHNNDPWANHCIPQDIPGISLTSRNEFEGEYLIQAKYYNALHISSCASAATEAGKTKGKIEGDDGEPKEDDWRKVGLNEGLPVRWDDVLKLFGGVAQGCQKAGATEGGNGTDTGKQVKNHAVLSTELGQWMVLACMTSVVVIMVMEAGWGVF